MALLWNIYRVNVHIDQIGAGLRANLAVAEFAVAANKPSNREFAARAALGEEMPDEAALAAGIVETMPEEEKTELATFRRCRDHDALYVPNNYPRAVFKDAAAITSAQLKITPDLMSRTCQFWPGVLHLVRADTGEMLTQADEVRELRGAVIGFRGPRSIVQLVEVVYDVALCFSVFALSATRRPGPVTAEHIEAWLSVKQNAFSPHRSMGYGSMLDYTVETIAEKWDGSPRQYAEWEREAVFLGWPG